MKTIFISHTLQQLVMEKFYEKNQEICKLVQLRVGGRDNDVFLLSLFFESEELPQTNFPGTNIVGLVCSSKNLIEKQDAQVAQDPNLLFGLFYDFDFNTYKLTSTKGELKIQYQEWLPEVIGIYNYLCWPRSEIEDQAQEIADQFKGKKYVYINDFAGPLNYVSTEAGIKLTDKNQKDNATRIAEVKKNQIFRDTGSTLRTVYYFNIELWTVSENDGTPSKVVDFVKVSKVYLDHLAFYFIDDFAANHVAILEKFLNDFSKVAAGQPSTLISSFKNKLLVKSAKVGYDPETFGTSIRLNMRVHPSKLRNVHFPIVGSIPLKKYLADPNYIYFHYLQDNAKDDGWGCAYRSLQSIFSWFLLNGYTRGDVPTIEEIQQILVDIGDKPAGFVGSSEWIGSTEISYVLHKLLGIDCQFLDFKLGSMIVNNIPKIKAHFETTKTPVMIGGSVLAWTLLGVAVDEEQPQNTKFLILDPHYKGKDEIKLITNAKNKAVYWADAKIFKSDAFYNFCCPQLKK